MSYPGWVLSIADDEKRREWIERYEDAEYDAHDYPNPEEEEE